VSPGKNHTPYMREHSKLIRCLTRKSIYTIEEDPVISNLSPMTKAILVVTCRNRQRLLSQAWQRWIINTDVVHDYSKDVVAILSQIIPDDELRSELEVEVISKWAFQNQDLDPTGLAYTLFMCKSKTAVVNAIQHCRLERYQPRLPILTQNELPKPEEGHYTVVNGTVNIVIFPPDSVQLLQLHSAKKNRNEQEVQNILDTGKVIDTVSRGSGFGELSTMTKMKRSATVRAGDDGPVDLIVLPAAALLELLEHRHAIVKGDERNAPASAELMDYLRQSGLVYKASMIDVMEAASCMEKTDYKRGSVLFRKGDPVDRLYIVLSGEILLDTREYTDGMNKHNQPFQHLDCDKCFILKSGSIIGDEGMVGTDTTFESSGLVVSETASFFEVTGFGISFLASRLGVEKYSALVYKDYPLESGKLESLNDDLILHSTFHSLRKAIAMHNPYRGRALKATQMPLQIRDILVQEREQEELEQAAMPAKLQNRHTGNLSPQKVTSKSAHINGAKRLDTDKSNSHSPQKKRNGNNNLGSPKEVKSRQNTEVDIHGQYFRNVPVLSAAALHHAQAIHKKIKKRELHAMRVMAQNNVITKTKAILAKKDSGCTSAIGTVNAMRQAVIEDKFQRALAAYVIRQDDELEEEKDKSRIIRKTQFDTDPEASAGILAIAAATALSDFDSQASTLQDPTSESEISFIDPQYRINPNVPRIEQYISYMTTKKQLGQLGGNSISMSTISGELSSEPDAPKRPPPLLLPQRSMAASVVTSKPSFVKETFVRMSTIYTVGVETMKLVDKDGNARLVVVKQKSIVGSDKDSRSRLRNRYMHSSSLRNSCASGLFDDEFSMGSSSSKVSRHSSKDKESAREGNPRALDAIDRILLNSTEDNRLTAVKTNKKKIVVPEHLWNTRYLHNHKPGSPRIPYHRGKNLKGEYGKDELLKSVQRADTQNENAVDAFGRQDSEYNLSISPKSPAAGEQSFSWDLSSPVHKTSDNQDNKTSKKTTRQNVLISWQNMIERDPTSCRYTDGRKKASKQSRFCLKNLHGHDETASEAVPDRDVNDLVAWKTHCIKSTLDRKNGPCRSLPVLANRGSHALYWGKKAITTDGEVLNDDESLLRHSLQKLIG